MTWIRQRLNSVRIWLAANPRAFAAAIVLMSLALVLTAGSSLWFVYDVTAGMPSRAQVRDLGEMAQSTTILDAKDAPVFTIFKEQRIEIPLERMSPVLIDAVIAVEDQRFYDHNGIDLIRIGAAVLRNVQEGRRAEGGSTITQQLARQTFLSRDKTFRRKFKEILLAAHIEGEYDKKEILQLYLNKVYFGDGLYGVEAASLGYFGKHASEVNLEEAALLAGLIQSPSSYAPTENMERAIARRNVVLQAMLSSGAIGRDDYERARRAKPRLSNAIEFKETFGLYFKEQVRKELVDRFGGTRVAQGGLKVYTTLDADLQRAAEKLVEDGIEAIEKRRGYKHDARGDEAAKEYLQGALVAIDPRTGAVRAMVGGRDFGESRFNRATQAKRQSGSAFKPFVYAAALEAGYAPASLITNLNSPLATPQGDWVPEDEHSSASSMTMRSALRMSSNRAAVQMLNTIGIPNAVSYAQKLNVGTPPSVPSLALGASEVTLLSLTAAYGAFANSGIVRTPVLIRRVEDSDGKVLYEDPGKSQRAVSEATAFLMASMLSDVVNYGTAYRARQAGFTLPAAGKTGTTNEYVDAWFVGFTPSLVTGVWVGFDQPKPIVSNGYGGELAVPIWAGFMKVATKGDKSEWFERPANVVGVNVCRSSGKLPNAGCTTAMSTDEYGNVIVKSMVYTDYFVKGTQPTSLCPVHASPYAGTVTASAAAGDSPALPAPAAGGDRGTLPLPPAQGTTGVSAPPPAGAPPVTGGKVVEEEKPKKRGFWSRLFGRGDKKDDKDQKDQKEQKPKKPGGGER
ncbi:MAG TPA: PBP1A family penicillin-binding protein [Vicinamibacterales bacterium]|nr:PBP1A family penicillin-binding protein [Vicinamibacterales bacterium]